MPTSSNPLRVLSLRFSPPPNLNEQIVRESGDGTFKTRDETEKGKKKYTTVVVALLVASFVIPMVQYYWYVKDD